MITHQPEWSQEDTLILIILVPEIKLFMVEAPVTQPQAALMVKLYWLSEVLISSKTLIHGVNKIHLSNSNMQENSSRHLQKIMLVKMPNGMRNSPLITSKEKSQTEVHSDLKLLTMIPWVMTGSVPLNQYPTVNWLDHLEYNIKL